MTEMQKVLLICVLLSIGSYGDFLSSSHERFKRKVGWNTLQKILCKANPLYANGTCRVTPVSRNEKNMTLTITIFEPHNNLMVRIQQFQKMNSNRFMPGFFDFTFNLCDLVKEVTNPHSVVRLYFDNYNVGLLEKLKHVIHPCPYVGLHSYFATNKDTKIDQTKLNIIPPADYRVELYLHKRGKDLGNGTFIKFSL